MGKRSQIEQNEKTGMFVPLSGRGSSRPLECRDWLRETLLSWLFQTCIALQTSLNHRFAGFGMTAQEASVLMRCVEAGKSSPGRLAILLGRDKGIITRFVDGLEARSLGKTQDQST